MEVLSSVVSYSSSWESICRKPKGTQEMILSVFYFLKTHLKKDSRFLSPCVFSLTTLQKQFASGLLYPSTSMDFTLKAAVHAKAGEKKTRILFPLSV